MQPKTKLMWAFALCCPQILWCQTSHRIISDWFTGDRISSVVWSQANLHGGTASQSGGLLTLAVPAASNHDNTAGWAQLTQVIPDTDFAVITKMTAKPPNQSGGTWYGTGISFLQDTNNGVYCEYVWSGFAASYLFSCTRAINGAQSNTTVSRGAAGDPGPYYLEVIRSGSNWTLKWSIDGVSWSTLWTFAQTYTISQLGLFTNNYNSTGSNAQAYSGTFDYVCNAVNDRCVAQNVSSIWRFPTMGAPAGGGFGPGTGSANGGGGGGGGGTAIQCSIGNAPAPGPYTIPAGALNVQTTAGCGATGNGTTNDASSIQACINKLTSGGTLFFPSGHYNLGSTTLTGSSAANTTYIAQPGTATILQSETAGGTLMQWNSVVNGVTVKGLTWDGGTKALAIGTNASNPASGWTITGNTFQNENGPQSVFNNFAIFASDGGLQNSSIDHNTFSYLISNRNTRGGCTINGTSYTNWPDCPTGGGIFIYGASQLKIQYNNFDHVHEATHLCLNQNFTAQNIYVGHNSYTNVHRMGLEIQGTQGCSNRTQSFTGYNSSGMTVEDNLWSTPWDLYWQTYMLSLANTQAYNSSGQPTTGGYNMTVRNNLYYGYNGYAQCGGGTTLCTLPPMIEAASAASNVYGNYAYGLATHTMIAMSNQAPPAGSGIPLTQVYGNYVCNSYGNNPPNLIYDENSGTGNNFYSNTQANSCPSTLAAFTLGTPTVSAGNISATATLSGILTSTQMLGAGFYVDANTTPLTTVNTPPYSINTPTAGISSGSHGLKATGIDQWCNAYPSSSQSFNVP